ncbi:acyl-CoA thioesterase [Synoicihabitans lomoniglobus]|uniref:Thioesterase family protein n=1 Tax=Synoicihabitans lomoniglobus TaxID=2909285 RepID=A0AAF0I478_9BACT|nr:acyl-CoA thioesterase [Opitutaceae bacterium LMO-M01]WED66330.1 thioesterase family protein [Opitutaceae bacterium LMO-M01]
MPTFSYSRTIHFPDTDAAGVIFFARYLSIAHEAYEEALADVGIPLGQFFSDQGVILPIAKSEASYLRPLVCGDRVRIDVTPTRFSDNTFTVDYVLWKLSPTEKRAAVMRTEHVCLDSSSRARLALPAELAAWVDA